MAEYGTLWMKQMVHQNYHHRDLRPFKNCPYCYAEIVDLFGPMKLPSKLQGDDQKNF